ncbi:gp53-like domain-containing protein [Geminicoccus harenae]|uniref:gp53-like domain-containing protein n=1 Tax=Geminicoccus harenae TaxID=2498453 RepID=UPI00168AD00D|nr:hypothetical protein [Geminicoccus harenae]
MAYLGNSPLNALFSFTPVTLAQGQTQVLVNYTPGRCLFFKNGALLDPNIDYTAANGSTVTLASPASAGDVLTGINLASFAVANALPLTGGTVSGPLTGPASASETTGGLIELATTAEAQALLDDLRALTPKKLADAFKGANTLIPGGSNGQGFFKLPSGLIVQFGSVMGFDSYTVTLPIAFPSRHLMHPLATAGGSGGYAPNTSAWVETSEPTAANFKIFPYRPGPTGGAVSAARAVSWLAIGV